MRADYTQMTDVGTKGKEDMRIDARDGYDENVTRTRKVSMFVKATMMISG